MVTGWLRWCRRAKAGGRAGTRGSRSTGPCTSTRQARAWPVRTSRRSKEAAVKFDQGTTRKLIQVIADTVIEHAEELTDLDRAIGDADHGVNLDRGFRAVLAKLDAISALPINDALNEVGKTLIMTVGGAAGPLYGKLFATIGQRLTSPVALTRKVVVSACDEAIR